MIYQLSAACGCTVGRVRPNNEDNFYFAGKDLYQDNRGMNGQLSLKLPLTDRQCFAVFDGMGGEAYGEAASFQAAEVLKKHIAMNAAFGEAPRDFLNSVCRKMNQAVCQKAQELCVNTMGSTAAVLLFVPDEVYVCNLGDSRIYRLRDNTLMQLSVDDLETVPPNVRRKPGLTQYLGIDPEEMILEPHIAKCELRPGDVYLICSDGITDMLSDIELCACLREYVSPKQNVENLIQSALKAGGRDNATAIVVRTL